MELIPMRFGYRLNVGGHQILLTKKDMDELVRLLTDDGAKVANVGGKRRYTKKDDFMAMAVGEYTVLHMTFGETAKVNSTLQRCKHLGADFTFQIIGGRKMPKEDMDEERDYLITRTK
jgi:hypothetical protein